MAFCEFNCCRRFMSSSCRKPVIISVMFLRLHGVAQVERFDHFFFVVAPLLRLVWNYENNIFRNWLPNAFACRGSDVQRLLQRYVVELRLDLLAGESGS